MSICFTWMRPFTTTTSCFWVGLEINGLVCLAYLWNVVLCHDNHTNNSFVQNVFLTKHPLHAVPGIEKRYGTDQTQRHTRTRVRRCVWSLPYIPISPSQCMRKVRTS